MASRLQCPDEYFNPDSANRAKRMMAILVRRAARLCEGGLTAQGPLEVERFHTGASGISNSFRLAGVTSSTPTPRCCLGGLGGPGPATEKAADLHGRPSAENCIWT